MSRLEHIKEYYEMFLRVEQLLKIKPSVTIAIEGNSGSGKSCFAKLLEETYQCNVIHMDDFFLPPDRKTRQRLSEPGGNVDYERFEREVIEGIKKKETFEYQVFDCRQGRLTEWVKVIPNRLNIIEGVYSLHPNYQDFYDLKIFLYTPEAVQESRILKRNGPYLLERFKKEWIPLENEYFEAFKIKEISDYRINTTMIEDADGPAQ